MQDRVPSGSTDEHSGTQLTPRQAAARRYVSRLTRNTLAVVMAGGRGERLKHLTDFRCKPATPFGGKFRDVPEEADTVGREASHGIALQLMVNDLAVLRATSIERVRRAF